MTPSGAIRSDLITESRAPAAIGRVLAVLTAAVLGGAGAARGQFSSSVNVVEVYVSVTNDAGTPVTGLEQRDFTVRENGVEQQVSTFAAGQFPLSAAVALDRSFSMAGERLAGARSAARVFLGALRPEDQSMVIAIGSRTETVAPLSADRAAQLDALSALQPFGTTGLHDAIVAAIGAIQQASGRRALILLSDGSDRYSTTTAGEALAAARRSDVLIYPIAFGPSRPALFAELATLTGGRSYHITDMRRLPETLKSIAEELRNQYLLGYSPERPIVPNAEEWRAISVEVRRPGLTVRARDGYLAR